MKLTTYLITLTTLLVTVTTAAPIPAQAAELDALKTWNAKKFLLRVRCVWHFHGEQIPENAECLRICNTKGLKPGEPCEQPHPGGSGYIWTS